MGRARVEFSTSPQQRCNRSNSKNPKEKCTIFYSFIPLAAVAALLRLG
jgi:hypothetical protein